MGFLPDMPEAAGEYFVEIRRESFYLKGEHGFEQTGTKRCPAKCDVVGEHTHGEFGYVTKRHAIFVYEDGDSGQGAVEILLEDVLKIRACLDVIEAHFQERHESPPWKVRESV